MRNARVRPSSVDCAKTRDLIKSAFRKSVTQGLEGLDLIKIADILGIDVATIPQICPHCGESSRPDFGPEQVRYAHQLKKGLRYYGVHIENGLCHPYRHSFVVVREPYIGSGGHWCIDADVQYTDNGRVSKGVNVALCDRNIYPYENGNWNTCNYIAFTDESRHLANCCCCHHCCPSHC